MNIQMEDEIPFEPSAYGFRSIKPRTRAERLALVDKVALEKNRIAQRVGFAAKMQRENAPPSSSDLTSCIKGGAGYLAAADRFHSDVAGEEYLKRQEELKKKQRAQEFRKNQVQVREEERWQRLDQQKASEEQYWQKVRSEGSKCGKNKSNVDYNITNLEYNDNPGGEEQKYHDDMVRYRASVRTVQLVKQGDSKVSYNIISGSDRNFPEMPKQPQHPHRRGQLH